MGAAVLASADGCVVGSFHEDQAGGVVTVFHPDSRLFTRYVHLGSTHVWEDEWVHRGQRIGTVGLFPWSGGIPHLHWEMSRFRWWAKERLDPQPERAPCSDEIAPTAAFILPVKCDAIAPEAAPVRVNGCRAFLDAWWFHHSSLREDRSLPRGLRWGRWKSSPDDRWELERRAFELRNGPLR